MVGQRDGLGPLQVGVPGEHGPLVPPRLAQQRPHEPVFGRSPRDTGLEAERNNNFTSAQRLHLLNSSHILKKIQEGPGLQRIIRSEGTRQETVDKLYLTILSRHPTEEELSVLDDYPSGGGGLARGLDVAWVLMNTAEFLCRH